MTLTTTSTVRAPVDTPFSVLGYISDPKLVGYQILTNYESTYWAPLVGNDAWRLYEVLRSFCHHGNNTCYPSINLLLSILNLKDRSVLIGRAKPKEVNGKVYSYPGLIQTLQAHNLLVAEVDGEGPLMRYIFHVNLTPSLLTDDQLNQLPSLLQEKHQELLDRCEAERQALEAKKKPSKLSVNSGKNEAPKEVQRGIGNSNTPLGNSNTPSWNFQYKQQPMNTTHITPTGTHDTSNNNSSGSATTFDVVVAYSAQKLAGRTILAEPSPQTPVTEVSHTTRIQEPPVMEPVRAPTSNAVLEITPTPLPPSPTEAACANEIEKPLEVDPKADVTAALIAIGLAETVVQRLVGRYSVERISEKIEFLAHLQEHAPERVKNPRGWLRRAIEENYAAPDGYKSAEEQAAAAADAQYRQEDLRSAAAEQERQREQERARKQQEEEAYLAKLQQEYGTTQRELDAWKQVLAELALSTPSATFNTWLANSLLLSLAQGEALVGLVNPAGRDWVENRLAKQIERILASIRREPKAKLKIIMLPPRNGHSTATL